MKKEQYIRPKITPIYIMVEEGIATGSPQNQQESIVIEDWNEEEITKRFDIEGNF